MIYYIILFVFLLFIFIFNSYTHCLELFESDNIYAKKIAKEIEENLSKKSIGEGKGDLMCVNKNTSRDNLLEFVKYLRNDLLTSKHQISRLKQELENCESNNKKKEIQQGRKELSDSMSGDTSFLSGLSSSQTAKMLNSHLEKPLTMNSFNEQLMNQKPESTQSIQNRNQQNSKKMDKFLNKKRPNTAGKLKNNYLANNMINVQCPGKDTPNEETNLGSVLLELANDFGFTDNKCKKEDKECQKQFLETAHKRGLSALNNLTGIFGCHVDNQKGLFPDNLKSFASS